MTKKWRNTPTRNALHRLQRPDLRDLFKQDADYPFVDWNFSGSTQEEFATLMSIFDKDAEVYIADYEHTGVYACRIIVPGMSDIYPAEDLLLANNSMGAHLRDTLLALPGSEWEPEEYRR